MRYAWIGQLIAGRTVRLVQLGRRVNGMKKVRYPAEISRPAVLSRRKGFVVPDPSTMEGQTAIENENREMLRLRDEAIVKKLRLLMARYRIENEDDWLALARALAFEHVKDFELSVDQLFSLEVIPESDLSADSFGGLVPFNKKSAGRHLEWSDERLFDLRKAVEKAKAEHGWSKDLPALKYLARRRKWRPPANHRGDLSSWVKTLQNCLSTAKNIERPVARHRKVLQEIAANDPKKSR